MSAHASDKFVYHEPGLQHQFDDMAQQEESVSLGMWMFLVQEIMFFGGLFTAYLVFRSKYPMAFAAGSNHLDAFWGGLNTLVLIVSSLTMALTVYYAQKGQRMTQVVLILLTMFFGAVFLGVKAIEYTDKFTHHLVPGPNFRWEGHHPAPAEIFYSLYFCMTGLHALHMIIGLGIMTVIAIMAWKRQFDADYYTPVEVAGLYWHFVDIVWIFLFPLLYLVDRSHHFA